MIPIIITSLGLLAVTFDDAAPAAKDAAAYQEAKAHAQRDPQAHIRLALWCEAHGMNAERLKHLAIVVLADPNNATARGLLGLVRYGVQWEKPDEVAKHVRDDPQLAAALAEYNAKRQKNPQSADEHWQLAVWCEQHGLKAEAFAHFSAVVRLDPKREAAWKRLGYKKHHGRWMTDSELASAKTEAEAQKQANLHWVPILKKCKERLSSATRRAEAQATLAGVTDPRAVPAVWKVFVAEKDADQTLAVQLLGQIDAPAASRTLAMLAVFGKTPEVRRQALEVLKRRDPREFADVLISLIRDPVKYEIRPVGGPGSPGILMIEGKRVNIRRVYSPPGYPTFQQAPGTIPGDILTVDPTGQPALIRNYLGTGPSGYIMPDGSYFLYGNGIPPALLHPPTAPQFVQDLVHNPTHAAQIIAQNQGKGINPLGPALWAQTFGGGLANGHEPWGPGTYESNTILYGQAIAQTQRAARSAEQQLEDDKAALDRMNDQARKRNEQVTAILHEVTGQDFPPSSKPWQIWWTDQLGYALRSYDVAKPTVVENVPLDYQLPMIPGLLLGPNGYFRVSCFGRGTLVHTLSGSRPIETLEVGDEVLSQDAKTGALGYQPILVVHRNPPSKTFEVRMGDETIVSSPFHRFWRAGKGWAMARELKEGDTLRTLSGLAPVTSIAEGPVQKVYNLDVAETASFFVGQAGALVHDNTLPTPVLQPFDAPPILVAQPPEPRPDQGHTADAVP